MARVFSAPHAIAIVLVASLAAPAAAELRSSVYAGGFSAPLEFVQDPTDPAVQYVVEQGGLIRIVRSGVVQPWNFLDLSAAITSGGERGLLGMAFAPDYAASRRVFLNFTDLNGNTVVARFLTDSNNLAIPWSRFDLRWPSGL